MEMRNSTSALFAAEEPMQVTWGDWLIFDALRMDIEALLDQ
jgi:hypothetical protein